MKGSVLLVLVAVLALAPAAVAHDRDSGLRKIHHFVVIYQENHSFDNLYGGWEGVDGVARRATPRTRRRSTRPARRISACCRTT